MFADFYGKYLLDSLLDEIKALASLLWGEKDQLFLVDNVSIWQANIKNLTVKIWPEIGHMPMFFIPKESAKECLNFLNK